MRKLAILLLTLAVAGIASAHGWHQKPSGWHQQGTTDGQEHVENIIDHGGLADAVDASTCTGTNPKVCTVAGTGTDNTTFFARAQDAIDLAGGGVIYFPMTGTGKYRLAATIDGDNTSVRCDPGVQLMPTGANGSNIFTLAKSGAYLNNIQIEGCEFFDDYPEDHGHEKYAVTGEGTLSAALSGTPTDAYQNYNATVTGAVLLEDTAHGLLDGDAIIITGTTGAQYDGWFMVKKINENQIYFLGTWVDDPVARGTWDAAPALGQDVTWSAGGESGVVVRYDLASQEIRIAATGSDTLADGDDVTEDDASDWTATAITIAAGDNETGAGVRAIHADRVNGLILDHITVRDIPGDAINLESTSAGNPTKNVQIIHSTFINTPSLPETASAISVRAAEHVRIAHNYFDSAVRSYNGANVLIGIANQNDGADDILIMGNHILEEDTLEVDQVDQCISFSPNASAISNVSIIGNVILCDVIFDSTAAINSPVVFHSTTNPITDTIVSQNRVKGGMLFTGHASNTLTVSSNIMTGTQNSAGIQARGTSISITGNQLSGYGGAGILIITTTVDVLIQGNFIRNTGSLGNGALIDTPSVSGKVSILENTITGVSSTGTMNGIECSGETESYVFNNTITTPDSKGIVDCRIIGGNIIDTPPQRCIDVNGINHTFIFGNWCNDFGSFGIEVDGTLYARIEGNKLVDGDFAAIQEKANSFFTSCVDNISIGSTYTIFTINDANINNGPIAVGDDVELEATGVPNGVIVSATAGTPGTYVIIPDSIAADDFDTAQNLHVVGGGGWDTDNGITVSQDAVAAQIINCPNQGSTEVNSQEIPAP